MNPPGLTWSRCYRKNSIWLRDCSLQAAAHSVHLVLRHFHLRSHSSTLVETPGSPKICRCSVELREEPHTVQHEILKRVQKSRTPGGEGGVRQTDIPPHAVHSTSHAPHFDQRRLAPSKPTPKPSIAPNTDCMLTQIGVFGVFSSESWCRENITGGVSTPVWTHLDYLGRVDLCCLLS